MLGLTSLSLLMSTVHCGGSGGGSSSSSGSTTKKAGDAIALKGSLAIASTGLALVDDELPSFELAATTGTIKCTYATATEDKADVDANGSFTLSCKAGTPMVISYFDADGNPTCSLIFKISKKDSGTATLNQDIDLKKITCSDGSATVDLDTLAPDAASGQTFTQDSSVTLVNGATDHWAFTVDKQVQIGVDGKATSTAATASSKPRKKTSLALVGGSTEGGSSRGPESEVGKTINMAFMEETCSGGTDASGIITVQHQEDNTGEGGGTWACIDGATITWNGTSFSINLTEEKDVAGDMAKHEIDNQRPPQSQIDFKQVGTDGTVKDIDRDPTVVGLDLLESGNNSSSFAAPDSISVGMNFPLEAYCANTTKWNKVGESLIDTADFGTPCTNFKNFQFVDFGKFCSKLKDTVTGGSELAKGNVMQCSTNGGQFHPSSANQNDPQCASDYQDFPGGRSPVDDMARGVDDLRDRLALIVKIRDLAKAGDSNAAGALDALNEAVGKLTDALQKVIDQMNVMKTAVAQIKANRIQRCTATTQTPRDPNAEQALYAKMDGRVLQPLFNAFQQLFNQYVHQNPPVNELFRRYVSAPTNGFDGTACVIPDGADKVYNFDFLKPTGSCKFTSNIIISGVFKDAKTIKPMQVSFMDKPNGECNLSIQHIAFDPTTGCWLWDGLKPKLTSEAVDKGGMFTGGLIQRNKLIGSSVLTDD